MPKIKGVYEDETPDPPFEKLPMPAGYRVLVRTLPAKKMTASGMILPDNVQEMDNRARRAGRVIAVGPEAYSRTDMKGPWCKVGDIVVIPRHGPIRMKVEGEDGEIELAILNDDEVIATIQDTSAMNLSYY